MSGKTKLQIKMIFGTILFEHEQEDNNFKKTVEKLLEKFENETIIGADLSNLDLSNIDFSNSKFDNSTFDNSKFYNSTFYNSKFDNSTFDNSKFYNSKFYNSTFDNSKFYNSKFYNSTFYNSKFYNSTFYNSKFYNSTFYNSKFDEETMKNIIAAGQLGMFDSYKADFWMKMLIRKTEVEGLKLAVKEGRINGSSYEGECCCFVGTVARLANCNYTQVPNLKPNSGSPVEIWFMGINKGDTPENSPISRLTLDWIEEFELYLNAK